MNVKPYAKAVYAAILAALTAAAAIYVAVPALTIALAAVTALGVYMVPNAPEVKSTPERGNNGDLLI